MVETILFFLNQDHRVQPGLIPFNRQSLVVFKGQIPTMIIFHLQAMMTCLIKFFSEFYYNEICFFGTEIWCYMVNTIQ